jgi:hypothetical protein
MNPKAINRNLHKACLIVMEASLVETPELWVDKKAHDVIECINYALKDVKEDDIDSLGTSGMVMYGWLYNQRSALAESLVTEDDLEAFYDAVEQYVND